MHLRTSKGSAMSGSTMSSLPLTVPDKKSVSPYTAAEFAERTELSPVDVTLMNQHNQATLTIDRIHDDQNPL